MGSRSREFLYKLVWWETNNAIRTTREKSFKYLAGARVQVQKIPAGYSYKIYFRRDDQIECGRHDPINETTLSLSKESF